jgi:hypothetical protein
VSANLSIIMATEPCLEQVRRICDALRRTVQAQALGAHPKPVGADQQFGLD